jgi:hypothetical protein
LLYHITLWVLSLEKKNLNDLWRSLAAAKFPLLLSHFNKLSFSKKTGYLTWYNRCAWWATPRPPTSAQTAGISLDAQAPLEPAMQHMSVQTACMPPVCRVHPRV